MLLLAVLWAPLASRAGEETPINSYTVVYLGHLGMGESTAYGLNDAGQVVGSSRPQVIGVMSRAFLWQNDVMTDLGTLGGPDSRASAINNSGQVVGWANTAGPGYVVRAFLWDPGTGMRSLGTLGGTASHANGINDAGQVVGTALNAAGTWRAFLWQNGQMVDLGTLPGYVGSGAHGINASGQVAGYATDAYGRTRAFLWTPNVPNGTTGTMVALHPVVGNYAYGVNRAGEVVGEAIGPDGYGRAVLWDSAGAHALPLLPNTTVGAARAINDSRFVVGDNSQYYEDPGYGDPDGPYYQPPTSGWIPYAFVWDAGHGTHDLSALTGGVVSLSSARGINASGQIAADGYGAAYLLTPSPLPTRPGDLWASAGDTRVTLSWSASSGATSYRVKRAAASGGPYTTLVPGVTGTRYTDTAVMNGNTYYYVVSAVNAYGESANSYETWARPVAPPAAPTGLTAVAGDQQVTLSWNASEWADWYQIYRSTTAGGPYEPVLNQDGYEAYTYETTYVDAWIDPWSGIPLENGVTYYYVVVAGNAAGRSGYSNEASATPMPPPPPPAPTGLTATAEDRQVRLTWNASAGADYYLVKRATSSGGPYTTAYYSGGTSYTDQDVTNGTTYYYVVTAVNRGGESPGSNEARATPTGPPPPAAPTGLTATAGKKKVTLKWAQSTSSGVMQNRIYRSTTSGGPYSLRAAISAGTSFSDTRLTPGATYYYVVTAVNSSGKESAYSNQASARPR
jgi:probable HAF family extracellular repeat protein